MIEFKNLYGSNSSLPLKLALLFDIVYVNALVLSYALSSQLLLSLAASFSIASVLVVFSITRIIVQSTNVRLLVILLLFSLLVFAIAAYALW